MMLLHIMFQITSDTSLTLREQGTAQINIHLNLPVLYTDIHVDLHIPEFYTDFPGCTGGNNINLVMGRYGCSVRFPVIADRYGILSPGDGVRPKEFL